MKVDQGVGRDPASCSRTRTLASYALVFSLCLGCGAFSQEPPRPSPHPREFPAQVDLVTIEVTVLDRSGKPVPGLTQEDFVVFENGEQQQIATFEAIEALPPALLAPPSIHATTPPASVEDHPPAVTPPWTYVVLFDDLHLTPPQATDVRKATARFLSTVPDGSRIVLVATGARIVEDHVMPDGRQAMARRLAMIRGSTETGRVDDLISDQEAYDIYIRHDAVVEEAVVRRMVRFEQDDNLDHMDPFGEHTAVLRAATEIRARAGKRYDGMVRRARMTLGVLRNTLEWLAHVKGRKTVVLASRGFFHDPSLTEFEEVLRASLRSATAVSFLDARGLSGSSPYESAEYGPALEVAGLPQAIASVFSEASGTESLALDSGGMVIHYANNLTKGLAKIADASRAYYLLGFEPSNRLRDGKYRRLSVKLGPKGKDYTVTGRRGYYAPRD